MITHETVFVLGAGASSVFLYPTGSGLLRKVYTQLKSDSSRRRTLFEIGFSVRDMDAFADALLRSGQSSVDLFLERRTEFMEIGKAAMAAILVPSEDPDRLWSDADGKNWMLYLFSKLNSDFDEFHEHKLAFITYNYDRTLEHFLMTSLRNTYGKSEEECKAIMPEVIHLHGRLDYLPWEIASGGRDYGDVAIDLRRMKKLIDDIKIVHEDPATGRDKDFKRALELLSAAKRIYFLGFGYAQTNLDRLEEKFAGRSQGTAFDLTQREISNIVGRTKGNIQLHDPRWDCMDFLRNVVEFD